MNDFRSRLEDEKLREIYDLWKQAHQNGKLPRQNDLDLMSFPRLAPNCFIVDIEPDRRFRYRFLGTSIDRHIGRSLTGRLFNEVRDGQLLSTLDELFGGVADKQRPGYAITRMPTEESTFTINHRLVLPLSDDGMVVNKLFGGHMFIPDSSDVTRTYTEVGDQLGGATVIFEDGN